MSRALSLQTTRSLTSFTSSHSLGQLLTWPFQTKNQTSHTLTECGKTYTKPQTSALHQELLLREKRNANQAWWISPIANAFLKSLHPVVLCEVAVEKVTSIQLLLRILLQCLCLQLYGDHQSKERAVETGWFKTMYFSNVSETSN